jgi:hypothetical protein
MNTIGRMQELSMGMNSSTTDSPRSSGPSLPRDSGGGGGGTMAGTGNNSASVRSNGIVGPNTQAENGFKFNYDAPKPGSLPAKGGPGLRGGMGFGAGGLFQRTR